MEIAIFPPLRSLRLRLFLLPSTLLIVLSNLVPLAGVAWWHWDAFLILILYWCETAAIAFWTMAKILALPPGKGMIEASRGGRLAVRIAMVAFFTFHAGLFMAVHLLFLWAIFGEAWRAQVAGPGAFFRLLLIESGLWLPLLVSFIGRGIAFLFEEVPPPAGSEAAPSTDRAGAVVGALYGRIVVMHITILIGAWLAHSFGSLAPLALLIGLKTAFDVLFHISIDLSRGPPRARTGDA